MDNISNRPNNSEIETYSIKNKDCDKINLHKEFLKNLHNQEEDRLSLIENKTFQIVSQTGVIFALLSLFIPIFIDNISELNIVVRIGFIIILIITFLFYLLTINSAIKNFQVNRYKYVRQSSKDILKYQNKSIKSFCEIEINDMLYAIDKNTETNNRKATNLIKAYKNFRLAIIFTGILGVSICVVTLFINKTNAKTIIENHIKIENIDSTKLKIHSEPDKLIYEKTGK
uniref:hypothetical protein n=1 Tax=uncultured Dysgonomonas sp. TaxID=206096 RepID=UPI002590E326|nr:hypothetical protein [uncultured Dysgonomonas sp.]